MSLRKAVYEIVELFYLYCSKTVNRNSCTENAVDIFIELEGNTGNIFAGNSNTFTEIVCC